MHSAYYLTVVRRHSKPVIYREFTNLLEYCTMGIFQIALFMKISKILKIYFCNVIMWNPGMIIGQHLVNFMYQKSKQSSQTENPFR